MNKLDVQKELNELITRFKQLKKALAEEDTLSPAQRAAAEVASNLVKGPTLTRERVLELAKGLAEQQQAQRLAQQLQKSGVLGTRPPPRQPTREDQEAWIANQGIAVSEEMAKNQEAQWGNSINSWLSEATKPLNSRFKSEAEEQAYWDSIKINGGGRDEGSGY